MVDTSVFMRTDWINGLNLENLRRGRLERAKTELFKKKKLGSFLSINEWNTRYITSTFTPMWTTANSGLRYSFLASTAEQPILYEQGDLAYHTKKLAPWLGDQNVRYAITGAGWISRVVGKEAHKAQLKKMVNQIMSDLKDWKVAKEPMGIDVYDPFIMEAFKREGVEVTLEGAEALYEARKIKLPEEVQCIAMACRIAEAAFDALRKNIRPGVSEWELMGEMMRAIYRNGGEVFSGLHITSGPYTWPNLRCYLGRMIEPGDVVFSDVYNMAFNGYKTCYYRTFSCGRPSKATREAYQRALTWLYDAIKAVKPGVTTDKIAEKWPPGPDIPSWKAIGVVNEDMTAGNNWAHGIGLTLYEPPLIWRAVSLEHPQVIEKGMCFAMETQEGNMEGQGVRIEEVLHVTESGVEVLSKWPVNEITVCEI
jgi:Xaa-Pro aminopeptidase